LGLRPADLLWKPDVRPSVIGFDESGADGVFTDIMPRQLMVLLGADAVIEIITLPRDAKFCGSVSLPIGKHTVHTKLGFPREGEEGMKVIRHEEDDLGKPIVPVPEKTDRFENPVRNMAGVGNPASAAR
jgi:hypothetical protein